MFPYLQAVRVRWAVLIALVALAAGCTAPASVTSEEIYVNGQRPPMPVAAPPLPFRGPIGLDTLHPIGDAPWLGLGTPLGEPRAIEYNGGFEEGDGAEAAGWLTAGGARRDTAFARTGAASLFLPGGSSATQTIGGVEAGNAAWLTYSASSARQGTDGWSTLRIAILALDAEQRVIDGAYLNDTSGPEAWSDGQVGPIVLDASAVHVRVLLAVDGSPGVHVDDVELFVGRPDAGTFVNGGFEEGRTGWELARFAAIDCGFSFAPEGKCSLRLDHSQGGSASQRLAPAGGSVRVSYTYASQVSDLSERWLYANMTFLDASGSDTRAPFSMAARMAQPGWKQAHSDLIPLPPGTATVVLQLEANVADPAPTWVDEVLVLWSGEDPQPVWS